MNRSPHSGRLERWLGAPRLEHLSLCMRGATPATRWYGRPIKLIDVPGNVWVTRDGDFIGNFDRGSFASVMDAAGDHVRRLRRMAQRVGGVHHGMVGSGFASISDALARASQGYSQRRQFIKAGATSVTGGSNTLWRLGSVPAAGSAGAAAPGGTAQVSSDAGALAYANPASGTNHLVGADVASSVVSYSLLVYDRLFSVAKTMNATTTEAVTGVPTRYQSTTASDPDYAGDNFLFVEVASVLPATAHNWTVCTYNDQGGSASTLPSLTGNASAITDRLDHPVQQWFAPLEAGDVGIKALTQMQCSAAVATGSINFVIGHPLGFMTFPVINVVFPFDWLTNRDPAPRIFDNACLAFMQPITPTTTGCTYTGRLVTLNAAP